MQHWLIYSELYSAPSPPYQAVFGCSLEPSCVYLPPAASHNPVAPLPTSRVLHHTAGAHSAICQHHLLDLLSQDYLFLNPHPFYQGFKACKQEVTIWKERLKKSEAAVPIPQHLFFFLPAHKHPPHLAVIVLGEKENSSTTFGCYFKHTASHTEVLL